LTLATIDIGTNTTLLLVARRAAPVAGGAAPAIEVLAERAEITRLGRGIGSSGRLGATGIAATLEVLRQYVALARQHGARIVAIGTEGLRRAPNADEFLKPAAEILGGAVEVIDGHREAELTFRATVDSFPDAVRSGTLVVIDIGGGSTEIITAEAGQVRFRVSLPLGSVRLTERHVKSDPAAEAEIQSATAEVDAALASASFPAAGPPAGAVTLVGVAGTVTSLAAMAQGLASYDPTRVHGYRLQAAALDAEIARLARSTQAQRETIAGLDPRRADVILAGALILREIARKAGVSEVLVSDRGIRWGLLYEQLAA
jgi:exopolyphosphatase/guanosine-5'-triphosphate,3'-diphosphate pyrophosphatase